MPAGKGGSIFTLNSNFFNSHQKISILPELTPLLEPFLTNWLLLSFWKFRKLHSRLSLYFWAKEDKFRAKILILIWNDVRELSISFSRKSMLVIRKLKELGWTEFLPSKTSRYLHKIEGLPANRKFSSHFPAIDFFFLCFTGKLIKIKSWKRKTWECHKPLDPMNSNLSPPVARKEVCYFVMLKCDKKEKNNLGISRTETKILEL